MYKMNLLLKLFITVLTIFIVVITNNRISLWLLLVLVSFYHLHKKNYILIVLDLVLVVLLGLSKDNELALLIFKIGYIIVFLVTMCLTVTKSELVIRNTNNKTLMKKYYEDNYERFVKSINVKKEKLYDEEVSIDNKIERDLERKYLQSRIRYNDVYKVKENSGKWTKIDTLILIFTIIMFVILFILK